MKNLAVLIPFFLTFSSVGQDLSIANADNSPILYRGFENKVVLNQVSNENQLLQIEAINCKVTKQNENVYLVKTENSANRAKINLISNGEIVSSLNYRIENLPTPSLFWGDHMADSTISTSREIHIDYSPEVTFESNFEIVGWHCQINDLTFEGTGNLLSQEVLDFTKSMSAGEFVKIEAIVQGADGILRKQSGMWVKE